MKANQRFSFIRLPEEFEWSDQAVDGKKSARCAGSGSVKDSGKKSVKENWEEQEPNSSKYIFL